MAVPLPHRSETLLTIPPLPRSRSNCSFTSIRTSTSQNQNHHHEQQEQQKQSPPPSPRHHIKPPNHPSYSSVFPYSSQPHRYPTFKILVVGAGIGGLMLGHCLERAGIEYTILERHHHLPIPPSTIQLTGNTLHVLEQLGLLEQVMKIAIPVSSLTLRKHDMKEQGSMNFLYCLKRYGHYSCQVLRTEFCQILMSGMKKDRIQWGRYVLEVTSDQTGVQCRCANGHVEQGDVLVGADGAHSAVRQNLYRTLKENGILPKSDQRRLKFTQNAIMGMTEPLDPKVYPTVGKAFSEVQVIIGKDSPYTMWVSPVLDSRINWCVTGALLTKDQSQENFKVSGFGPEDAEVVCSLIKDLRIPFGEKTLADLIALTPKESLTKMLVEEKHYKTWHYGRTVLLGEACHKFVSFSGQGAEQAMLDAVCLSNLLHKHPSSEFSSVTKVFETYHQQRLPFTKAAVAVSGQVANMVHSQGWTSDWMRKLIFNVPDWVQEASVDKVQSRPLLDFLPEVKDRGTHKIQRRKG